jgi:hypothetical protein
MLAAVNEHCPLGVDDTAAECETCAHLKWEKDMAGNVRGTYTARD